MQLQPFKSASEAWAALEEQERMNDGEVVDLMTHQLQTAARYSLHLSILYVFIPSFLSSLFSHLSVQINGEECRQ